MCLSPGPTFSLAGEQNAITSTSVKVDVTKSFKRWPKRVLGLCTPGRSTMINWESSRFRIALIALRVVCGLELVMANF